MKNRVFWKWGLGVALTVVAFAGVCLQGLNSPPTNTVALAAQDTAVDATAQPAPDAELAVATQAPETDLADAAVKPISTEQAVPPNIKPTAATAQIIRLAESGVSESVLLAFATNSSSVFDLRADEIIYLNDIGVPGSVVTAMIQRDQTLKEMAASSAAPAPAPYPAEPAPAPAPEPAAPPPDYPTEPYAPPDYATEPYPPPVDASYSTFYDSLAPYGTWVDVGGYGPCWQPTVGVINPTWQPYFDCGRWIYTDCGWYWLSSYSWGWAPFHYGRWFCHHRLGWCWAPDTVWGPSWVCWRSVGSYCGWAPLPPGAWFTTGIGLTFHGAAVTSGFGFGLGANSFAFVDFRHFNDHHLRQHALPRDQANRIFQQTVVTTRIVGRNNTIINNGIAPQRVAAATGTPVHRVAIRESSATTVRGLRPERLAGDGQTLTVFRPPLREPARTPSGAPVLWRGAEGRAGTTRPAGPAAPAHPAPARAAPGTRAAIDSGASKPFILRGSGQAAQAVEGNAASGARRAYPPGSLVVVGKRDGTQPQASYPSAPSAALAPQAPSAPSAQNSSPRAAVNRWWEPGATRVPQTRAPSQPSWYVQRAPQPGAVGNQQPAPRSEVPRYSPGAVNRSSAPQPAAASRQYAPPAYQAPARSAPAEVPRYSPAPTPARSAPAEMPHYSPAPAPAPQRTYSPPVEPRAAPAAPAAPAPSAPASPSARNSR